MKYILSLLLLLSFTLVGCGRSSPKSQATTPVLEPVRSDEIAPTSSGQPQATATATTGSVATGPYILAVHDSYPFFATKLILGVSLATSQGKVWLGTLSGSIEEVDAQSGTFGKSISLIPGAGAGSMTLFPTMKMTFEGDYLWAWGNHIDSGRAHPYLLVIDTGSGTVLQQWDLDSSEWLQNKERMFPPEDFGVSPGKIWIDNHVIDARTFEVTPEVYMPGMTLFAYNGTDWMWMTGDTGSGDGLVFVNASDPSKGRYQNRWPFLVHQPNGSSGVGPANPLVLAGDRMWIGRGFSGENTTYSLEAYTADIDELMNEMGPLASVPLLDSYLKIKMLYTGGYLWVVYTGGEKAGMLCQLDPRTGKTINSLDLVGEAGRTISDVPQSIATESDNLWVLTTRQLLRIKLP